MGYNVTQRRHTRQQTRTMNTVGMKCNVRAARVANKQNARATRVVQCRASANNFVEKVKDASKVAAAIGASVLVAGSAVPSAQALTFNEKQALTYLQAKGSGLANTCPVLDDGVSDLKSLKAGDYNISKFCLEPTSFEVKEEAVAKGAKADFVETKLMTRLTYTLDEISGKFKVGSDGSVELKEEDGIDYAATTVQLPGGERVPFLFTVKELEKENSKSTKVLKGSIVFSTASINNETGEIAGVFESIQPSDTDLGAKAPKDIKITGLWYGQLS